MTLYHSQTYNLGGDELHFDAEKSILLCRDLKNGANRWIKKISGIGYISSVIEDADRYYLSGESSDTTGFYLALDKKEGTTMWSIPGKAFMNALHDGSLYLIFPDENNIFYLIKVDSATGRKEWHHPVGQDLREYSISGTRVTLEYNSGEREILSPTSGRPIR
jgi:outer membrane protein assembly factor BamB